MRFLRLGTTILCCLCRLSFISGSVCLHAQEVPKEVATCIDRLMAPDFIVRQDAAEQLIVLGRRQDVLPLLAPLLRSPREEVRQEAWRVKGTLLWEGIVPEEVAGWYEAELRQLASPDPIERVFALGRFAELAVSRSACSCCPASKSPTTRCKRKDRWLRSVPVLVEALQELLGEPDPLAVQEARWCLALLGEDGAQVEQDRGEGTYESR